MNKEQSIIWLSGLFEGEGTFSFHKNRAKGLSLTSTDKDVLDRIVKYFGGNIYNVTKREEHWKDCYIWSIRGKAALSVAKEILPYLLSRRSERGTLWINSLESHIQEGVKKVQDREDKIKKILELRSSGKTHQQIADEVGYERSHVSKILKR